MSKIGAQVWGRVYEKTVETKFAETHWPVYREYRLFGMEGFRHLWAPRTSFEDEARSINPLTPKYADLFLRFARWFDKQDMEACSDSWHDGIATLDTPRNGEAALRWAHEYGVLGLGRNGNDSFAVGGGMLSSSTEIAAHRLGAPNHAHPGTRAYSKGRKGGRHETVEAFVFEAYEANVILKLYEAATAVTVDVPSVARFMSSRDDSHYLPARYRASVKTEREWYSQDPEEARHWALAVVEETVNRKVENDVYPILLGEPGSYREGWGFKSLLGAMWFQMRNFMLGEDNKCERCGRIFHKTRRDKTYCGEECGNRARAARGYERKRRRQEEAREATRQRLRDGRGTARKTGR